MISSSAGSAEQLPYGQVKAKTEKVIQINERTYILAKQVRIADNGGKLRALADIKVGDEVEFRLTRGKVDLIILIVNGT